MPSLVGSEMCIRDSIEKAEKFAKEHNGNLIFGNLEELAKSKDVDAVYIASPNSLHYEQARLMIKNKKHVMIEKTITSNLRELNELCRLAKENNVVIICLLYTSDAADDLLCVDLGGRRIIKKNNR